MCAEIYWKLFNSYTLLLLESINRVLRWKLLLNTVCFDESFVRHLLWGNTDIKYYRVWESMYWYLTDVSITEMASSLFSWCRTEEPLPDDEKRRNYGGVYVGLPADLTAVAASQSKSTRKDWQQITWNFKATASLEFKLCSRWFTTDIKIFEDRDVFGIETRTTSEWHHRDIILAGVQKGTVWNTEHYCDSECRHYCHGNRRPPDLTLLTSWYFGFTMSGHYQTRSTVCLCNNKTFLNLFLLTFLRHVN